MIFFCFYSLTISISMYCIYIRAIFANDILYGFSCHTSSYPHSHTHPHSPVLSSGQSLPTAYCTVSHVTHPLTLSLIHIHSYTSIIRAIFANGILHGFSCHTSSHPLTHTHTFIHIYHQGNLCQRHTARVLMGRRTLSRPRPRYDLVARR